MADGAPKASLTERAIVEAHTRHAFSRVTAAKRRVVQLSNHHHLAPVPQEEITASRQEFMNSVAVAQEWGVL